MGFKTATDKPYTKADYYREMEERAAAKRAASFSKPIIVEQEKEPAWLEPDPIVETVAEQTTDVVAEPETIAEIDFVVKASDDVIQDLKAFTGVDLTEVATETELVEEVKEESAEEKVLDEKPKTSPKKKSSSKKKRK